MNTLAITTFFLFIFISLIILFIVFTSMNDANLIKAYNANDEEVIVHMTTHQGRVNQFVPNVVKSFENMDSVSEIIVSVKEGTEIDWIPGEKVYINYIPEDYGPATKFLGLMHMDDDFKDAFDFGVKSVKNKYFFICDDDIQFKDNLIGKMVAVARKNPEADIITNNPNGQFVNYYRGYIGNLIRPSFFKRELLNIARPSSCFPVDDQWIQFFIKTYSINMAHSGIMGTFDSSDAIIEKDFGKDDGLHSTDERTASIKNCRSDMELYYNVVPRTW